MWHSNISKFLIKEDLFNNAVLYVVTVVITYTVW
jgi:hypothetical protein